MIEIFRSGGGLEVWRIQNVVIWENGKAGGAGKAGLNIGFGRVGVCHDMGNR